MVKNDITKTMLMLSDIHRRLMDGQVYLEAINEVDTLIHNAERKQRTPVEVAQPEYEVRTLFGDFVDNVQQGHHVKMSDQLITGIIENSTTDSMAFRRMLLVTLELGLENNLITTEQLTTLFRHFSQPQVMLSHIDEPTNKAAYGRSIAVNIIRLMLIADRSGYFFLTQDDLDKFLNTVGMLPVLEKDSRGFVSHVGWVHMYTGIANLYSELCEHDELVRGNKIFLLSTLVEGYKSIDTPLDMGENEDVASFLIKLFDQHRLYQEFFVKEVEIWRTEINHFSIFSKEQWVRLFNYRRLMQSLIMDGNLPAKVMKAIVKD